MCNLLHFKHTSVKQVRMTSRVLLKHPALSLDSVTPSRTRAHCSVTGRKLRVMEVETMPLVT